MLSISGGFYTSVNRYQNSILFRGYDANGKRVQEKFKYRPTMFLPSKETNTKWKALDGTPVEPMQFSSMSDLREFQKTYEGVSSMKLYGNDKHIPAFIQSQFPLEIQWYRNRIDVANFDIETMWDDKNGYSDASEAANEIASIAIKSGVAEKKCNVWGTKPYDPEKSKLSDKFEIVYHQFVTERQMLQSFIEWWSNEDNCPDVITGWNIREFDIPYLINRCVRILGEEETKRLSPWGKIDAKETLIKGKKINLFEICGIQQLDYMDLFKKFGSNTYGNQESYTLGYISHVVLGETKVNYSDEVDSLQELYDTNHQTFIDYNITDVLLVERLEEKLGMISLVMTMAYMAGVNYSDTMGTTAIWDAIIFRRLAKKHVAIPPGRNAHARDFAGGYVKQTQNGGHKWIVSFDAASLYPSIMMQYNLSPETFVPQTRVEGLSPTKILKYFNVEIPDENLIVTANGACWRKDIKGIIPEIVEELFNKRVTIKNTMITAQSEKEILLGKLKNMSS